MVIVSVAVPTSDMPSLEKAGVDARVDTDSRLSRDMRSCSRRFGAPPPRLPGRLVGQLERFWTARSFWSVASLRGSSTAKRSIVTSRSRRHSSHFFNESCMEARSSSVVEGVSTSTRRDAYGRLHRR